MSIDVKPINVGAMDCFESIFASVLEWKKIHHEILWINSIGFDFIRDDNAATDKIGKRVTAGKDIFEFNSFAKEFLNIYCTEHLKNDPDEDLIAVRGEISEGRPVMLLIDPFWLPWKKEAYGVHHLLPGHSCLAVGMDNEIIHCIDTVPKILDDVILPISDFKQGCNAYITFCFDNSIPLRLLRDDLLDMIIGNLKYSSYYTDSFRAMREFGRCVNELPDYSLETAGYTEHTFWLAPIINSSDRIFRSYGKFSMLVEFLNTQYHMDIPSTVLELIERGELIWNTVLGLFTKAFFSPGKAKAILTRTSAKIIEAADTAEEICNELQKFRNNDYASMSAAAHEKNSPQKGRSIKDVTFINLTDHFNNKGFGRGISPDNRADLNGFGYYLLSDGIPDDIWAVQEIKYQLPDLFTDDNDNISCDNQVVDIRPGCYNGISILGCAETRNQGGFLNIFYSDGSSDEIVVKFTDWCAKPLFGETVAWTGLRVCKYEGKATVCEEKANLLIQQYEINCNKTVVKIVLPDCWNLHIFAISLFRY